MIKLLVEIFCCNVISSIRLDGKQFFVEQFFWPKFFFVANSFTRKHFGWKNCLVENFCWSKFCFKFFSSETVRCKKNVVEIFVVLKFILLLNLAKFWWKNILGRKFLLQNQFLGNSLDEDKFVIDWQFFFEIIFWLQFFFCYKIMCVYVFVHVCL